MSAEDLENADLVDLFQTSRNEQICAFVHNLTERFLAEAAEPYDPARIEQHLNMLIHNLYTTRLTSPQAYLRISLNKSDPDYSNPGTSYNPNGITFRFLSACLNYLVNHGLMERERGFYDRERRKGRQTRIRATERLADGVEMGAGPAWGAIWEMEDQKPLIVLKDSAKNPIPFDEIKAEGMPDFLERFNAFIRSFHVDLKLPDWEQPDGFKPSRMKLYRVFNNGSFTQGGRFYGGWWQMVKSGLRPYIHIDGESTIERDYSSIQPNLLYAKIGATPPEGDLYAFIGDEPEERGTEVRKTNKAILLIALNAGNEDKALSAIRREISSDAETYHVPRDLKAHLRGFLAMHEAISGFFFSGVGLRLQKRDSDIAELVLGYLMDRGIPALPIHDSFIVPWSCQIELAEAMREAIRTLYPAYGIRAEFDPVRVLPTFDWVEGADHVDAHEYEHDLRDHAGFYERERLWRNAFPEAYRSHETLRVGREDRQRRIAACRAADVMRDNVGEEAARRFLEAAHIEYFDLRGR